MAKLAIRSGAAPTGSATIPAVPAKAAGRGAVAYSATAGAAKKRKRSMTFGRVINGKGLAVFTRQLATLVKAGMPILRSLEVLARQEKRPAFKEVIESIAD